LNLAAPPWLFSLFLNLLPHFFDVLPGSAGSAFTTSCQAQKQDGSEEIEGDTLNVGLRSMWFGVGLEKCSYALRRVVTAPTVVAAMPPINNHMDLSVGVPVKNRLVSEPNDSEALIPKTISAIPTARRATPMLLFMVLLS
jgi:hypothetical protein